MRGVAVTFVLAVLVGFGVSSTMAAQSGRTRRSTSVEAGKATPQTQPVAAAAPRRYAVVTGSDVAAPSGVQTLASVQCPAGSVVYGGGVFVASISLQANVNSSWPEDATHWGGWVNNASGSPTTFRVYAVCAKQNAYWSIQSASAANPGVTQTAVTATCPAGTKALGGGGHSSSSNLAVNFNSSGPVKIGSGASAVYEWAVDMNNGSTSSATATSYAVCGRASGYKVVRGSWATNPSGSQSSASATCPSPKVPLGGGIFSNSDSTLVNVNGTYPGTSGWAGYENNDDSITHSIRAVVVCAGT